MSVGLGGMDPNALQQKALEAAKKAGEAAGDAAGRIADAGVNDVARFQEAMCPPENLAEAKPGNEPPPAVATEQTDQPAPALGDRILNGMASASEHIQASRAEAVSILGKTDVTQVDLLRANFAMMESGNMVSAIAKTTEKITQGIKTLQQG